jgi:hypothetical protein
MAYVDIPALKRSLVDQLAEIMPNDWEGEPSRIDYAHPGDQHQRRLHAWFFNGRGLSEPATQSAGRKRRDQTWTLTIMVQASRQIGTVDGSGFNVGQEKADAAVMKVLGLLDEWIADHPTLGQTSPTDVRVDSAQVAGFDLQEGVVATGVGSVGTFSFTFRARPK